VNIDESKEFGYEYWFQFEDTQDSCTYFITKQDGGQTSVIEIYDKNGDTLSFAIIQIEDIESKKVFDNIADIHGKIKIQLNQGKYRVRVSAMGYSSCETDLELAEDQSVVLKIILAFPPDLEVYQINSKVELDESEIRKIMDCVEKSRGKFHEDCSDKERYLVMMHI